jgi:hypothetical protein
MIAEEIGDVVTALSLRGNLFVAAVFLRGIDPVARVVPILLLVALGQRRTPSTLLGWMKKEWA